MSGDDSMRAGAQGEVNDSSERRSAGRSFVGAFSARSARWLLVVHGDCRGGCGTQGGCTDRPTQHPRTATAGCTGCLLRITRRPYLGAYSLCIDVCAAVSVSLLEADSELEAAAALVFCTWICRRRDGVRDERPSGGRVA